MAARESAGSGPPVTEKSFDEYRQGAEPDVAWWARAAIQQIEEGPVNRPPGVAARRALPPAAAAELVDLHLRLELGLDCIYSMRPRQILPRASALLQVQTEPFYQTVDDDWRRSSIVVS